MPYSALSQGPSITYLREKQARKPLTRAPSARSGQLLRTGRKQLYFDPHSPGRTGSSPKSIRVVSFPGLRFPPAGPSGRETRRGVGQVLRALALFGLANPSPFSAAASAMAWATQALDAVINVGDGLLHLFLLLVRGLWDQLVQPLVGDRPGPGRGEAFTLAT